jgi:hypothetical protein
MSDTLMTCANDKLMLTRVHVSGLVRFWEERLFEPRMRTIRKPAYLQILTKG